MNPDETVAAFSVAVSICTFETSRLVFDGGFCACANPDSRRPIRSVSLCLSSNTSDISRRSEEHTSELQSLRHLVCRLLLEKKKKYQEHCRTSRRSER